MSVPVEVSGDCAELVTVVVVRVSAQVGAPGVLEVKAADLKHGGGGGAVVPIKLFKRSVESDHSVGGNLLVGKGGGLGV